VGTLQEQVAPPTLGKAQAPLGKTLLKVKIGGAFYETGPPKIGTQKGAQDPLKGPPLERIF